MKNLSLILLGILAILSAVIVIRSARFTSRQIHAEPIQSITLDREAVARRLSKAIQFKTISFQEQMILPPDVNCEVDHPATLSDIDMRSSSVSNWWLQSCEDEPQTYP